MAYSEHDRKILRTLARRVAEIADLPIMEERRAQWTEHNALRSKRPMIQLLPEGSWRELLPASVLTCETDETRADEWQLRARVYTHEHFLDDTVIEKNWSVPARISNTGWGLETHHHDSTEARGAWGFDPVIKSAADIKKICTPEVIYDEARTQAELAAKQELFGDILPVKFVGINRVDFHLLALYSGWRGLNETLMDFTDEPEMVHEAMARLEEGNRSIAEQYAAMNLLRLNNDNTVNGSGGTGYTDELPAPGFNPERVRFCDIWASCESQELAPVSPAMHREFALQYEARLLEPFGLTAYGCCEDLTRKLPDVFTLPHIRRISISPWADVEQCAATMGDRYIYSWKPQPAHLAMEFDDKMIRDYLRHTLDVTRDCVLEIILKDTHTCNGHPERFDAWTKILQEVIAERG